MTTGKGMSMVPGSAGKGLGQQTGGTRCEDANEALRLLQMIARISVTRIGELCGMKAADMIERLRFEQAHGYISVTGRQLFFLRDIKDRVLDL